MKKIKFLVNVKDKNTGELYKINDIKEFEDARADEILNKKRANGTRYAELVAEEIETATKTVKAETAVKKPAKKNK